MGFFRRERPAYECVAIDCDADHICAVRARVDPSGGIHLLASSRVSIANPANDTISASRIMRALQTLKDDFVVSGADVPWVIGLTPTWYRARRVIRTMSLPDGARVSGAHLTRLSEKRSDDSAQDTYSVTLGHVLNGYPVADPIGRPAKTISSVVRTVSLHPEITTLAENLRKDIGVSHITFRTYPEVYHTLHQRRLFGNSCARVICDIRAHAVEFSLYDSGSLMHVMTVPAGLHEFTRHLSKALGRSFEEVADQLVLHEDGVLASQLYQAIQSSGLPIAEMLWGETFRGILHDAGFPYTKAIHVVLVSDVSIALKPLFTALSTLLDNDGVAIIDCMRAEALQDFFQNTHYSSREFSFPLSALLLSHVIQDIAHFNETVS